jgi:hypothetical protein
MAQETTPAPDQPSGCGRRGRPAFARNSMDAISILALPLMPMPGGSNAAEAAA